MKKIILIIGSIIFSTSVSMSQDACITIDPDGYTNVREQPNARSKIVGKVSKYEVRFSADDFCGNNMFRTGDWMPVSSDTATGYMYDKYMLSINELPSLTEKQDIKDESGSGSIICFNGTLTVTMKIQKFEHRHTVDEHRELEGMTHTPDMIEYMKKNGLSDTQIEEITIMNHRKGVKTILPLDKIKKYCNPRFMHIHSGRSNELYLYIGGGSGESTYGVWQTILNGQIIYQTDVYICW